MLKLKTPFQGEILIKNLKTWEVVKAKKQTLNEYLAVQLTNRNIVCWDLEESLLDTRKEWQILDNPETFYEKFEVCNSFNRFNVFLGSKLIKPFIVSKEEQAIC